MDMQRYECLVCGYVYDPQEGDLDGAIEPRVPFEHIPDGWVCPECGAGQDDFEKVVEGTKQSIVTI